MPRGYSQPASLAAVLTLIFLIIPSIPHSAAEGSLASNPQLLESFLSPPWLHDVLEPSRSHSEPAFTPEETDRLLGILRFLNPRRSPIVRELLRSAAPSDASDTSPGGDGDRETTEEGLGLEKLLNGVASDAKFWGEVVRRVMESELFAAERREGEVEGGSQWRGANEGDNGGRRDDQSGVVERTVSGPSHRAHRAESTAATRANCAVDYGAFVEPVTDRIVGIVCGLGSVPGVIARLCDEVIARKNSTLQRWGWRMLDSMGKIPHSLAEGGFTWVGAYDRCETTEVTYNYTPPGGAAPSERSFNGKYCRLDLVHRALPAAVTLGLGVCVPDSCNSGDVIWYITKRNLVLRAVLDYVLNMTVPFAFCGHEDLDASTDGALQTALSIGGICVLILLIATLYDGFLRKKKMNQQMKNITRCMESKRLKAKLSNTEPGSLDGCVNNICWKVRMELILVGFSAYSNIRRIFRTDAKPGAIPTLDGIRFLSFIYVIWGETYIFGPIYFENWVTANAVSALKHLPKKFLMQPVINFHLAADSFLLISGILLVYWFLKKYEGDNRLTWRGVVYSLAHRYWRLVPAMMAGVAILTCTYLYAVDGPLWPEKDTDGENCRVTWWVNLLMVHNVVKTHESCFSHAWFVPLVFQLHLAAMFIIVPLIVKPILGYSMLVAAYLAHITATAIISSNLREGGVRSMPQWYDEYLLTPWCRAGPFLIGLVYGILIYHRARAAPIRIPTLVNLLLWVVSLFCVTSVAFWSYSEFKSGVAEVPANRWSAGALTAYDTLARSSWAIGLGYIAFACHFGHGGVIGSALAWAPFTPLSRLVYTAMLMHPLMIFNFVYTSRQAFFVLDYYYTYAGLAHLIVCVLIGLVISLIFDYPLSMGLERALCCRSKFDWLRAGRHSHQRLRKLEEDFYGVTPATGAGPGADEEKKDTLGETGLHSALPEDVEKLGTAPFSVSDTSPPDSTLSSTDDAPLVTDSNTPDPVDPSIKPVYALIDENAASSAEENEKDSDVVVGDSANDEASEGAASTEKDEALASASAAAGNDSMTDDDVPVSTTSRQEEQKDKQADKEEVKHTDKEKSMEAERRDGGAETGGQESIPLTNVITVKTLDKGEDVGSVGEGECDDPTTSF